MLCYVEVWEAGSQLRGDSGEPLILYPSSGTVSVNSKAPIRRSLDMEVAAVAYDGTDLVADDEGVGPLGPYSTDLKVYRGFVYPTVNEETGSNVEVVPLGVFRLTRPRVVEGADGGRRVQCSGYDQSFLLQSPMRVPVIVRAGTESGAAFRQIVSAKAPFLDVDVPETRFSVPGDVVVGLDADPWDEARKIALAAGCNAFCDVEGRIVMVPTSTRVNRNYVWDFNERDDSTQFMEPERALDADESPNVITVIGNSGSGTSSVKVTVYDDDPTSPTYVGGRYGEQHKVIRTELVNNLEQATEMANAELANTIGAHEQIRFRSTCIPALQEWDAVRVTRAGMGINGRIAVIEAMDLPLTAEDAMDVTLRRSPTSLFEVPV